MKTRTIAFLVVTASMGLGGLGLAACSSSSDNSSGQLPGVDSSTKDTSTGSDSNQPDTNTGDSNNPPPDAGPDCKAPPTVHAEDGSAGPYCPFATATADAGKHCQNGQTCCHPDNVSPETCAASAAACAVPDGGATFGCDTPLMCPVGNKCCYQGAVLTDQACGTLYASKEKGTTCRATCNAGELEICAQQSDCTTGTCTAFSGKGHQLGYCK